MPAFTDQLLRDPGSELVLGLVAPVGADLDDFERLLRRELELYGYEARTIRLSELLPKAQLDVELVDSPEFDRLRTHMTAGNELRARAKSGEILALWAMSEIHAKRGSVPQRQRRTAYILRSIKHPEEAKALRAVYGPGFYLIGLSSSTAQRIHHLEKRGLSREQAEDVIRRDAGEENDYGQQTRDAFQLADVFVREEAEQKKTLHQLERFLHLVFGSPTVTPNPDEHAMFIAYASALRSGDLSRQVGAVVWKEGVGVVATGDNDVPAFGGGPYWPGASDQRDHILGYDANERHKQEIADQIVSRIRVALSLDSTQIDAIRTAVASTRLLDISEFGRAVHAEMDAILSCARAGIETRGATLFSTTFPCHNCAKHIVSAGIERVVYIEPYEKSKALELHGDSIALDDHGSDANIVSKVVFEPFVGVGPRRYFDLFSMRLSDGYPTKRKEKGATTTWTVGAETAARVPMLPNSYIERELRASRAMIGILAEDDTHGEDQD
jgi:deoxycytidylate deaminase